MIIGTAIGSFGFEFELPEIYASGSILGQTDVEKAMNIIQKLFQGAAEGSDDDIAELKRLRLNSRKRVQLEKMKQIFVK